jgi:hypothetical protein
MIRIVQRKNIDDERWNSIIAASKHETIYPYTWYMDVSADQWFGLVMGDYECVMPVAIRKKYTIKYVYQPFHNQQLGVYSEKPIDNEITRMFLHRIRKDFLMGNYAFNAGNILREEPHYELSDRINYVLSLNGEYEELYKNFAQNTRRNIRKSCKFDMEISDKISVPEFVEFKKSSNEKRESNAFYQNMERLLLELKEMDKIKIFAVHLGHEICAAAVFAFSTKRMIYMISASSDLGKEHRAMFHLVDSSIRMYAGEDMLMDFEGSNISSIARFFAGFGAKPEIYQRIMFKRLPFKDLKGKKNV